MSKKIGFSYTSISSFIIMGIIFLGLNVTPVLANPEINTEQNSDWIQLFPTLSPPARYHHAFQTAYDSQSDRIILFSGDNGDYSFIYNDTWAYDYNTNTWENMTTPEMKGIGRLAGAMDYDVESDRIILFGGWHKVTAGDAVYEAGGVGDTWSYDYETNTWTNMTTIDSPSFRGSTALAYDKSNDKMILYGGFDSSMYTGASSIPFNQDTWAYDYNTNTWMNMSPSISPPPLGNHELVYDAESEKIVLFGGRKCQSCQFLSETWVYDYNDNVWTNMNPQIYPTARLVASMVYIPNLDRIVLFGGLRTFSSYLQDTWSYDYNSNKWLDMNSPSPPAKRFDHSFNYDSESNVVILFGGKMSGGPVVETWEYNYQANAPSAPWNFQVEKENQKVT
ncbi:MAG: Kelch repeat-containing protein, partial [Candidatus Kariarchaeaceae archaeon]